ncbi:MAG: hypothetical protein HC862_02015 [Scytonema sp. RU_4_4]|nr:hypothetical protein [Scytonema sp. RU_4_4]NJR75240.1 hypothetical protein [Scytonema sp. CRU_2_7]
MPVNHCKRGFKLAPVRPVDNHSTERPQSLNTRQNDSDSSPLKDTTTGVTTTPRLPRTIAAIAPKPLAK